MQTGHDQCFLTYFCLLVALWGNAGAIGENFQLPSPSPLTAVDHRFSIGFTSSSCQWASKLFSRWLSKLGMTTTSYILNIRAPCAKLEPANSCSLVFPGRHEWVDAAGAGRSQDEVWRNRTMTAMACQNHGSEKIAIDFCGIWSRSCALCYFR